MHRRKVVASVYDRNGRAQVHRGNMWAHVYGRNMGGDVNDRHVRADMDGGNMRADMDWGIVWADVNRRRVRPYVDRVGKWVPTVPLSPEPFRTGCPPGATPTRLAVGNSRAPEKSAMDASVAESRVGEVWLMENHWGLMIHGGGGQDVNRGAGDSVDARYGGRHVHERHMRAHVKEGRVCAKVETRHPGAHVDGRNVGRDVDRWRVGPYVHRRAVRAQDGRVFKRMERLQMRVGDHLQLGRPRLHFHSFWVGVHYQLWRFLVDGVANCVSASASFVFQWR